MGNCGSTNDKSSNTKDKVKDEVNKFENKAERN